MDRHKQIKPGNNETILVTMTGSTLSTTLGWPFIKPEP